VAELRRCELEYPLQGFMIQQRGTRNQRPTTSSGDLSRTQLTALGSFQRFKAECKDCQDPWDPLDWMYGPTGGAF
jgi:hypothetical protein